MKYISEKSIIDSWKNIIMLGESSRAPLNKFFGFLELLRNIKLDQNGSIQTNTQYTLNSSELSNSLQDNYNFSDTPRIFNSSEILYIVFPYNWIDSVFQTFLKNVPLPLFDVINICFQNEQFTDGFSTGEVINLFKEKYHVENAGNSFFSTNNFDIDFSTVKTIRQNVFTALKNNFNITDNSKYTIGFTKSLYDKNAGELTAGPFIQPLYAGQENLKCLFIANFDIKSHYNINTVLESKITDAINILPYIARNKILYGAPGTGKSFELRTQANSVGFIENNITRITFHPNYSYQHFIGTYKPTPIYKSILEDTESLYGSDKVTKLEEPHNKEPLIDYSFVPGPLLTQLIKSLKDRENNFLIIIEEINRAQVSSVFGDVFQLLDRDDKGVSEYEIEFNADVTNYLKSSGISERKIKLPSNLFIWATMNSSDQGVMPMDAAFKRRWTFEYLPLNAKEKEVESRNITFQSNKINWNLFRSRLNDKLKLLGVSEDKLIGPFFLNAGDLENPDSIKHKLLLYLRDDVVRHNPENLFTHKTFSDIIKAYETGVKIFIDINFDQQSLETPNSPLN